ncbi:MAG: hypothetical protein LBV19_09630 [Streptococcaceae bacterium]|jgi:hypothetical protein|nr:hypothetical protein [Streptococcaceae bacterium]
MERESSEKDFEESVDNINDFAESSEIPPEEWLQSVSLSGVSDKERLNRVNARFKAFSESYSESVSLSENERLQLDVYYSDFYVNEDENIDLAFMELASSSETLTEDPLDALRHTEESARSYSSASNSEFHVSSLPENQTAAQSVSDHSAKRQAEAASEVRQSRLFKKQVSHQILPDSLAAEDLDSLEHDAFCE